MSAEDNEQVMLIWNDPKTNKNKFYEVTRTGDYVEVRYGEWASKAPLSVREPSACGASRELFGRRRTRAIKKRAW